MKGWIEKNREQPFQYILLLFQRYRIQIIFFNLTFYANTIKVDLGYLESVVKKKN